MTTSQSTASNPRLSSEQLRFFSDEGYLIVPDIFTPPDLEPVRQELANRIGWKVEQLASEGKLSQKHSGASFEERAARIWGDDTANGEAIMRDLEGVAGGGWTGPEMFKVITHRKMLAAVECFVGSEIVGSSVYRIRPKMPGTMSRGIVPWHQDQGYFAPLCDSNLVLTCWIPLVDANEQNGCMKILPRAHRSGVARHFSGGHAGFLVIQDDDLPGQPSAAITAECPRGGVVFMTNMTPHCSTPNHTNLVRWSLDLRYQGNDVPNNAGLMPDIEAEPGPDYEVACYPPEADFIIQSPSHPESVTSYEEYIARRQRYDAMKHKKYPKRDWQPMPAAV